MQADAIVIDLFFSQVGDLWCGGEVFSIYTEL